MEILKIRTSPDSPWIEIPAIQGPAGKSAYQIAVDNGFTGTEEQWLASLKGADGTMTFEDLTPEQKASLKGDKGDKGDPGDKGEKGDKGDKGDTGATGINGQSAYQIATNQGFVGTEVEWLTSLKGDKGETGAVGPQGERGVQGPTGAAGTTPVRGTDYWTTEDQTAIINAVVAQFTDGEATAF